MKTKLFELNWRGIILVSVLLGTSFSVLDFTLLSTRASGNFCPAPQGCVTKCFTRIKESPLHCDSSCGIYTCN